MKMLPAERKQDASKVGNVTTELLLPLGCCHRLRPSKDRETGRQDRELGMGGLSELSPSEQCRVVLRRGGLLAS